MGLYWGKASSNNKKGHMVGHIKDIGHDPSSPLTRLYATHAAQPFHNDSAGVPGMCMRQQQPVETSSDDFRCQLGYLSHAKHGKAFLLLQMPPAC